MRWTDLIFPICFWLGSAVTETASAGELCLSKIGIHLETKTSFEGPCLLSHSLACDDQATSTPSLFQVRGNLGQPYYAYVVAVDIDTAFGFAGTSFKLEYDPTVFVSSWQSCADAQMLHGDWPQSGSAITLSFNGCNGKSPDPEDPEGDATLLLGTFYIYGYGGRAAIGGLDYPERTATVVSCDGDSTRLEHLTWYQASNMVALGEVGFGLAEITAPCDQFGIVDNYCLAEWSDVRSTCCKPSGGCAGDRAQLSQCACENAGGIWKTVKCNGFLYCLEADCTNTAAAPLTWGKLKARY